jgi:hypothetical protein
MSNRAYWVLVRDEQTTELRFSKLFWDKADAENYISYYKRIMLLWDKEVVTLESLPYGEMPRMRLTL